MHVCYFIAILSNPRKADKSAVCPINRHLRSSGFVCYMPCMCSVCGSHSSGLVVVLTIFQAVSKCVKAFLLFIMNPTVGVLRNAQDDTGGAQDDSERGEVLRCA